MKQILKKNLINKSGTYKFYKSTKFHFSYIYHNFPSISQYYSNGKLTLLDTFTNNYEPMIQAFLEKRWITKQEIPPKIKIMNPLYKDILIQQKQDKKIVNLDENILRFIYEAGYLNRNYFLNTLFEKNEVDLYKDILDRVIMNGYVIKYFDEDFSKYSEIVSKIQFLVEQFYHGQTLTNLEKNLELIYILNKKRKHKNFKLTGNKFYQSIFTEKDLNNSKGLIWLTDVEYKKDNFNLKLILNNVDVNKYIDTLLQLKTIGKSSFNQFLSRLNTNVFYYRQFFKIKLIATSILSRLFIFLQSREFSEVFDTELNFYIFNAIVSVHLWLICQRLQNFKRSRPSYELIEEILNLHKNYSNKEFDQIDTVRKISKFKNILEIYENQKNLFHYHFNIYSLTAENNYFKIDSLVWSEIFREKIPRYDNRVYKMSNYIIYHFEKFKELTYSDYENLNINFDLNCIPFNYKNKILKFNPQLSEEELFKEKFSNFVHKNYTYEYLTKLERDTNHFKITYARELYYSTFDTKNFNLKSRRLEDSLYDELKDNSKFLECNEKIKSEMDKLTQTDSIFYTIFSKWLQRHYSIVIETCETEDLKRIKGEYAVDYFKFIGTRRILRFSEALGTEEKENLYKYRHTLKTNNKCEEENFKNIEMRMFHPDANLVTARGRRKPLADRIFNLKPY